MKRILKNILTVILMLLIPAASLFLVEYISNEDYLLLGSHWYLNLLFVYILFAIWSLIIPIRKVRMLSFLLVSYVIACINYFVIQFRICPILPSDVYSISIAMDVSGNYDYLPTMNMLYALAGVFLISILISLCSEIKFTKKSILIRVGVCALTILSLAVAIPRITFPTLNIEMDYWNPTLTYQENGFLTGFYYFFEKAQVKVPDKYAKYSVEQTLSKEEKETEVPEVLPNIIVIMNESFSDLETVGDFETNEELIPNYKALSGNVQKGYVYTSVYGGYTCNTESEFLTGLSMRYLPGGSIPYMEYKYNDVTNMASILNNLGYKSVAMHPYRGRGWGRQRVFAAMGFSQFLDIEDFEEPEIIRTLVSDKSMYDKIFEVFEETEEPLFLFGVSMQNHGGYTTNVNLEDQVTLASPNDLYEDAQHYLTLAQESDKQIPYLLDYFSNVDEPTIICFFGDHQPALDSDFIKSISGIDPEDMSLAQDMTRYKTPYFIWANFEIEECEKDISVNFLGSEVMDIAKLPDTQYMNFLDKLKEEIPVITAISYIDKNGIIETKKQSVLDLLKKYEYLTYYTMFDTKNMEFYK